MESRTSAVRTGAWTLVRAALVLFLAVGAGGAQEPPPWTVNIGEAPKTAAAPRQPDGVFTLSVHVTDRDGRPVQGLGAQDLTLEDNGRPVELTGFASSKAPDDVSLVLDRINLDDQQYAEAEKGVREYLSANGGWLKYPTMIYRIGKQGVMASRQPTRYGKDLLAELDKPEKMRLLVDWSRWRHWAADIGNLTEGAWTRQYMASQLSFTALGRMVLDERLRPGRKLLIWLGRGWQSGQIFDTSFAEMVEVRTRMVEARLELEVLQIWEDPEVKRGLEPFRYQNYLTPVRKAKDLGPAHFTQQVLAVNSGGQVEAWSQSVASQIERIVAENAEAYQFGFRPARTAAVDDYHALKAGTKNPEWTARTVDGYYDQPSFLDREPEAGARVSVEQLGAMLAGGGEPDKDRAARLAGVELTERPSVMQAGAWRANLPGPKSREALAALVARAAFQPPPAREIPTGPAPDVATQRAMLGRVLEYLGKTIPRLPDLLANETILHYKERDLKDEESWKLASDGVLRLSGTTRAGVVYRNGREELDTVAEAKKEASKEVTELATQGTFASIQGMVVMDAARSSLSWSRWEQGQEGRLAVFRFKVPADRSRYTVDFCCLTDMDRGVPLERVTGYHGELAIRPETGEILRLAVEADLGEDLPMRQADMLVEYGPVEIGGAQVICPLRSVAVTRKRTRMTVKEWAGSLTVFGPFTTLVNEVRYADYHRFGSESRILPGFEVVKEK